MGVTALRMASVRSVSSFHWSPPNQSVVNLKVRSKLMSILLSRVLFLSFATRNFWHNIAVEWRDAFARGSKRTYSPFLKSPQA